MCCRRSIITARGSTIALGAGITATFSCFCCRCQCTWRPCLVSPLITSSSTRTSWPAFRPSSVCAWWHSSGYFPCPCSAWQVSTSCSWLEAEQPTNRSENYDTMYYSAFISNHDCQLKCYLRSEQVTGKFRGGFNPFSRGCCSNCCYALCGPQFARYERNIVRHKIPFLFTFLLKLLFKIYLIKNN